MNQTDSAEFQYHVKQLRTNHTDAEKHLWRYLRANRFVGFKFKRQQPIDQYIVDFICLRGRLVIEVDGGHHQDQRLADETRTKHLNELGFRVLRFWNNEVLQQTQYVLDVIHDALRPSPQPSPEKGEGTK